MGKASTTVSVIVPAHNGEQCLAACLRSILAQTHREWEAVVVDDGSTDATLSVALQFSSDRLTVIEQCNQGQGAARNAGLAATTGEFVAFLDADDLWMPRFLEETVEFLLQHPEAVAVSCVCAHMVNGCCKAWPLSVVALVKQPTLIADFFTFWAEHDHVRTGTVLFRRSALEAIGFQRSDLRISQDLEFWAMLATHGAWGVIPEPLWIANSRRAARRNWLGKYRTRRRLCPTVEQWESRVRPRLSSSQLQPFLRVRGRVAAGLAHAMILGGRSGEARQTTLQYGSEMPRNRVTRLMTWACHSPNLRWPIVCTLLRTRESLKGLGAMA